MNPTGDQPSGLQPPVLLVAMPQVQDPFFRQSVVLLIHHDDEGSFGFIANRSTEIEVHDILEGMEIAWNSDARPLAYLGGPVQPQLGTVLFDLASSPIEDDDELEETTTRVGDGLVLTQHFGDLERLASKPPRRFRFFLGYSGWGEGQLVGEILRNDWLTAPVDEELLFADEPESVWAAALASVGVDPSSLPSWIPTAQENGAN